METITNPFIEPCQALEDGDMLEAGPDMNPILFYLGLRYASNRPLLYICRRTTSAAALSSIFPIP